mmetsp:Transcript_36002/g.61417  ORF Transcript_36002/g.61417 Transcript_36002/m.61417 type:complete len:340 (+) Transcript_36002:229-1248(+)
MAAVSESHSTTSSSERSDSHHHSSLFGGQDGSSELQQGRSNRKKRRATLDSSFTVSPPPSNNDNHHHHSLAKTLIDRIDASFDALEHRPTATDYNQDPNDIAMEQERMFGNDEQPPTAPESRTEGSSSREDEVDELDLLKAGADNTNSGAAINNNGDGRNSRSSNSRMRVYFDETVQGGKDFYLDEELGNSDAIDKSIKRMGTGITDSFTSDQSNNEINNENPEQQGLPSTSTSTTPPRRPSSLKMDRTSSMTRMQRHISQLHLFAPKHREDKRQSLTSQRYQKNAMSARTLLKTEFKSVRENGVGELDEHTKHNLKAAGCCAVFGVAVGALLYFMMRQ